MNASIENFIVYASQLGVYARQTHIRNDVVEKFTRHVSSAQRVFITGTGTSLPTAQYLTDVLKQAYDTKPVSFLLTAKMIRQIPHLRSDDLVIIISHGFNRADALVIYNGVRNHSKTVLITGKADAKVDDNTLLIAVPPIIEKTFCRPVSPVTTLLAIRQLFGGAFQADLPELQGVDALVKWIDPAKQTILLYSADVSYAAELWGIVLREGAGLNLLAKDIESYSHGYYGADTADLAARQYIILSSTSELDIKDLARADGLYNIQDFNKHIIIAEGDTFMANLRLFASVPKIVVGIVRRTNRDLDHPNGMEENRKYHEYDRYTDYYLS